MKIRIVVASILFVSAVVSLGCSKDPASCKTELKSSDVCEACCKSAGKSGYSWTGNSCTCL